MYINEELVRKVREGDYVIWNCPDHSGSKLINVLKACGVDNDILPKHYDLKHDFYKVIEVRGSFVWSALQPFESGEGLSKIGLNEFFKEPYKPLTEESVRHNESQVSDKPFTKEDAIEIEPNDNKWVRLEKDKSLVFMDFDNVDGITVEIDIIYLSFITVGQIPFGVPKTPSNIEAIENKLGIKLK
tara:strand:+ start:2720 stop:3277 length:558 start_codon:yes stop_codon:yes gene_type:complete